LGIFKINTWEVPLPNAGDNMGKWDFRDCRVTRGLVPCNDVLK